MERVENDLHALPKLPKAVKTRPVKDEHVEETEYAVSPNAPLLSTEVQKNAWVCGDNARGQLGVPGTPIVLHPQPIQGVGCWATIGLSEGHAAGLGCDGQLYTWGANHKGQLGLGERTAGVTDTPAPVSALAGLDVKAVACGLEHTVCITTKDVIAWGSNEFGQLGHTEHASDICSRPGVIKLLHDVMVTQVTCGRFHTICVTAQSQVYTWGHNSAGQLGLSDRRDRHAPTLIDALWALPVVQLAAGDAHSAALTSSGQMFIWGSNHFGQLGLLRDGDPLGMRVHRKKKRVNQVYLMALLEMGIPKHKAELALTETGNVGVEVATEWLFSAPDPPHPEHQASDTGSPSSTSSACSIEEPCVTIPKRVPLKGVRCIAAGAAHTLAVTDDACYSWGHGQCGALGHGTYEDKAVPTRIKALFSKDVEKVAAGLHHSLFLRRDGVVYGCGNCKYGQVPGSLHRMSPDRTVPIPIKLHLPFQPSRRDKERQREREQQQSSLHLQPVLEIQEHQRQQQQQQQGQQLDQQGQQQQQQWQDLQQQQPKQPSVQNVHEHRQHKEVGSSSSRSRLGLSNGASSDDSAHGSSGMQSVSSPYQQQPLQLQKQRRVKLPVVHQIMAGGNSSVFLTRGPDEIPEVYSINLLEKLQQAVFRASKKVQQGSDKLALASSLRMVSAGVEMVFGSAAAISAAFGYTDCVGLDVVLLERTQQSILQLFSAEEVERAVAGSSDGSSNTGEAQSDDADPALSTAIADLHKFSMMQSMYKSAVHLLEDLSSHSKLLHTPERAQVLLAASQNPLLGEHHFAKALLPRLCSIILGAHKATRHLLVKWWSDYPAELLEQRVVAPMQTYLTKELMATKKLTIGVMNAIKVLAKVEEANQVGRKLPPDGFYNQLISEKMDVQDHYTAWRQTQDQPTRRHGSDGPFSFCSYPFLLDPRAKSNLLHIEARFQMEQTVAHARMEQQLYGSSSRSREEDSRVIVNKHRSVGGGGGRRGSMDSAIESTSANQRRRSTDDGNGLNRTRSAGRANMERQGLRGLFFNILRSRFDSNAGSGNSSGGGYDSPKSIESQLVRRENSMSLPCPAECNVQGTHSDMCIVRVRRNHLVEDALDEIARQYRKDLFKPLRVHFIGEEGIDAGGVKKEFFQLLVGELLSPDYGMLVYQPETNTYWFNACSLEGEEQFMLMGLVLGLAIYNRVLLDFPLPLALYKKLLGQAVGLRDLEEMQPMLGRSLRQLLQYEGPQSVEETFCLTFAVEMDYFGDVRTISLKAGGEDIPVTEENRHEYVELMVDYLLNRSIRRQFEAFAHGFKILCDGPAIRLFNACEVERLVCGNPNLDFDALERNSKYEGGFTASNQAVQWLWQVCVCVCVSDWFSCADDAEYSDSGKVT
eukprot:GHRR01005473.1.p1 GENE.GHRR01005473.1~~GHRR01005473.1.p1  ORF type:complete len:1380 (+),score=526.24 GHRR01005473.1:240-4379(+)